LPALYGTTDEFLKVFGLKDLSALPTLRDLAILERDPGENDEDDTEEEAEQQQQEDENQPEDDQQESPDGKGNSSSSQVPC
jgi:chromosome segregation and condensation protein ScpB